jgi:hypothetical protein
MRILSVLIIASLALAAGVRAEDKQLAAAFAASAGKLAAEGKNDKAKDMCYKALANDEDCAEALFELAKLFEKENNMSAAGDFYVRAGREFGKGEAANPAFTSKRLEAETKIKRLNPYATRFATVMTDYAQELGGITKKSTDSLTLEEAGDRVSSLRLASIVPPDKMPQIDKPAPKTPAAPAKTAKTSSSRPDDEDMPPRFKKKEVVTNVPVDVEKALKAAGWDKITGTWKKVKDNVYEVTDGKLETAKANGAVQVIVHKGGGKVAALVRNGHRDSYSSFSSTYSYGTGYGLVLDGATAKMYTPYNYTGLIYRPYMEREIPSGGEKTMFLITIAEGALEMTVNAKREHKSNYKLNREGPFAIEIDGTATIESPMAKGQ